MAAPSQAGAESGKGGGRNGGGWGRGLDGHGGGRWARLAARPSLWMLTLLLVLGGIRMAGIFQHFFSLYPVAASTATILFLGYAVPFVIVVRAIDFLERQPPVLQAAAFGWGALVATSAAIAAGTALSDILAKLASPRFAAQWGPAVAAAGIEEILKMLGIVAIALVGRRHLNGLVDGLVYGALVGLGFQVTEDIVFAMNAVAIGPGTDQVPPVIATFLLRGFLGGLWSHTLFSALAGAGVAYAVVRRDRPGLVRAGVLIGLLLAAWGFHFLWNSPLLSDGFGFGVLGAIVVMLIKGVPALLFGLALVFAAERREADYYAALLAGVGDPRIATRQEIAALVSPRSRVRARQHARLRLGRAGGRAVRRLQRAQARLAVAISRDPGAEVVRRRREVLVCRHRLMALSIAASGAPERRYAFAAASAAVVAEAVVVGLILLGLGYAIAALGGS
jgi:RsiW-degrading membrane proteinase PrsW (M82 family)